jgi:hypothetical protein
MTSGQVAYQGRVTVQGRDTLIAVRLKIDRGRISEIEHLWAGGIAPQAVERLTTPTPRVTTDVLVTMETFSVRGGTVRQVLSPSSLVPGPA